MKKILIPLTVLAAASCAGTTNYGPIDVQAHRGGAGLYPENTIPAMKNALDLGVNTLEFDLHVSSDMQVVVSHDPYFHERYTTRPNGTLIQENDPKEYLFTMPYDSIAKYDVGLRHVKRWPNQVKLAAVKPLASELIDFTESYAQQPVNYNIEIKSWPAEGEGVLWPDYKTFCDVCIPLLLSKNLGDRLTVQSFDTRALNYIHEKWPDVILSYLTELEEGSNIEALLGKLDFVPAWWSPEYHAITKENVVWCHEHDIKVVPWTVDEKSSMREMASCGVDAIISNYPDRLIETVR